MSADDPLIVHVIHSLATGGMENGLINLINNMDRRYRHAIVCQTQHTEMRERIVRDDVELIELHKRPGKDPAHYGRLWKVLRRLRPDIVHTRNIGTIDAGVVARLAGVGTVIHGEHGYDKDDLRGVNQRYRWLRRLCSPFIRRFICVSQQITDWLRDGIGIAAPKLIQIYNGVDTGKFRPDGRSVARERLRDAGVDADFVVAVVGRLETVKNPLEACEAFADLQDTDSEFARRAALVYVGTGSLEPALRAKIKERGLDDRVHLLGRRDDMPQLLPGFDLYVLPSINEGISNTILEAMASGVPVIASRVGGNSELIVDEQTGCLYPVTDCGALTRMMGTYFHDSDQRQRHANLARERVERNFSLQTMTSHYERVYATYC